MIHDREKILAAKLLKQVWEAIEIVNILKDDKGYDKLLRQLQNLLVNTYDETRSEAVKNVISYLVQDKENFTQKDIDKIQSLVKDKLGKDLPAAVAEEFDKLTDRIFKLGKKEILSSVGIKFSFDVVDKEAVSFLQNFNNFWVLNYYDTSTRDKLENTLKGYFSDNLTLTDVTNKFSNDFNDLTDKGLSYFKNLAHITTNRTRSVGQINGLIKAKVIEYELFNPDPVSEICQQMNGTVFPIERAVNWRDDFLSLDSPEAIKDKFGWIASGELDNYFNENELSVDTADLPDGMVIPPLHGGPCKTTIRARFEN